LLQVFDEALVEDSTNNQIVKINEMASGMYVGERGPVSFPLFHSALDTLFSNHPPQDLMPTAPISNLVNNMMSAVFGGSRAMDTVLDIQHTVYAVIWLAINQSVSRYSQMKVIH
jgi:ubiquitin-conjugating enzyme E2 O